MPRDAQVANGQPEVKPPMPRGPKNIGFQERGVGAARRRPANRGSGSGQDQGAMIQLKKRPQANTPSQAHSDPSIRNVKTAEARPPSQWKTSPRRDWDPWDNQPQRQSSRSLFILVGLIFTISFTFSFQAIVALGGLKPIISFRSEPKAGLPSASPRWPPPVAKRTASIKTRLRIGPPPAHH